VNARVDQHALGRAADLAGAEEAAEDGAPARAAREVGVPRRTMTGPLPLASISERLSPAARTIFSAVVWRADEADRVDVRVA